MFKSAYESANGAGSFAAMLAHVPEPSVGLLSAIGCFAFAIVGARRRRERSTV
jgi:hypothetical protein